MYNNKIILRNNKMMNKVVEIMILIGMVAALILIAIGGASGNVFFQLGGVVTMVFVIVLMTVFGPSAAESKQIKRYFDGETG